MQIDADLIAKVLNIIVIDLVLSGDNAVVIGMAASRLAGRDRRQAIVWGVIGAIGLRVTFTAMFAILLGIPLLQLVGGLMLVWIAYKLVRPADETHGEVKAASGKLEAIRTIVMADVVMSLDNILAVGGASHGNVVLLLFGLALSMPLITFGSGFVAWALDRLPALIYAGAVVLAKVAGEMVAHDPYTLLFVRSVPALGALEQPVRAFSVLAWVPFYGEATLLSFLLQVAIVVGVLALGFLFRVVLRGEPTVEEQARYEAESARDVSEELAGAVRRRWEPGTTAHDGQDDASKRDATRSG
ncbi:MAG TPA: TerC family protein [Chloroflexota bacterium]|nr:TerC family protein [Chloroflexota bacterium]